MSRKVADEARVRSKEANRQNNGFWKTLAKVLLGVIGGCIVFLAPFVLVIVISGRSSHQESAIVNFTAPEPGVVVELCESEDCSPCGVTLESPWNEFEAVTCRGGGRMANEVHLTHPSAYLILCEVEVYGGVVVSNAVRKVGIRRTIGFMEHDISNPMSLPMLKLYDGDYSTDPNDCVFPIFPSLAYDIPSAFITHVKLLNFVSLQNKTQGLFDTENVMEGIFVDICWHGSNCRPCGVFHAVKQGSWGSVYCTGAFIAGNEVVITNHYDYLNFCEIEVFGQLIGESRKYVQMLPILGADASEGTYPDQVISTYDFLWVSHSQGCYRSQLAQNAYVIYSIQRSIVEYVFLLQSSSDDGSQSGKPWMDDLRIEVCENTRCSLCGVVQDSYYGHWKSVFCPEEGLIGDTVELYHDSNQIHFCDIEIFGRPIDLIAVETE